jgi:hypothetical protein
MDELTTSSHYLILNHNIQISTVASTSTHDEQPTYSDDIPFSINITNDIIDNILLITPEHHDPAYWALCLLFIPAFTIFGNILVVLSVIKFKSLQSAINYFIVALAIADCLVAIAVMPFAVYVHVCVLLNNCFIIQLFV